MPAPVSRRGLGPPGKPLELYDAGFVPLNYAVGTLGYACSQEIDNRITGKVASSTTMNFWSGSTRNSSCWVADLELSGIALSGTASALISPKHVLGAGHAPPTVGDTFQWVGGSGVTYTRTATSVDILSSDFLSGSDLSIA